MMRECRSRRSSRNGGCSDANTNHPWRMARVRKD
jgi:hypothetical protein